MSKPWWSDDEPGAINVTVLRGDASRLYEALVRARGYVAAVHGTLVGAVGVNNVVFPDLQLIDEAIHDAEHR